MCSKIQKELSPVVLNVFSSMVIIYTTRIVSTFINAYQVSKNYILNKCDNLLDFTLAFTDNPKGKNSFNNGDCVHMVYLYKFDLLCYTCNVVVDITIQLQIAMQPIFSKPTLFLLKLGSQYSKTNLFTLRLQVFKHMYYQIKSTCDSYV